ncbi:3-methyl-2-oxobutanoate hydroxymethyltransferase [Parapusillimonas granuli]|uniref:3-methyl-2-oxobutanoate hydroxymethyltransferase n=1 Tax=Parapusillimonas granuli TaxID=380911 RepID=A0A853FSB1_9BURK|nr:3-methyl-2-oxobutanoate hydroxymethyltransferase [Parapusillimonas granuli]MBB5214818.1 3-methyl-2-oxobutanoate hydroxymethyltransferase [Parapusillimonas granuli]MEB2397934.1 3-methyl-2-oxobutanoate hydroxymethyltransferase [Alcaligenaceae bacterium]NYT48774.1 3-methyl-2-oxobutanoate hydroxymethyltransferase [Parapusillimonas granuli]
MSVHTQVKRISVPQLMAYKGQRKIAALTAYSAPFARLLDEALDMILIGDSTAMVAYALPDTLSITVEQMAAHAAAVVRSTSHACVIVDMPFGSYQESPRQAFANAARMLAASGADGIKMEGGIALADTTRFLVERGIPVLAHVGLMPQYVNTMGGFKAQGMTEESAERILRDAQAHQEAGAFAVVLEGIAEPLGRRITDALAIPTIGIGASPACDGQILVTEDILGLSGDRIPKFARRFADVGGMIKAAAGQYAQDVREGRFPGLEHCFGVKKPDSP